MFESYDKDKRGKIELGEYNAGAARGVGVRVKFGRRTIRAHWGP